jgi:outer membrane protein OmpA-like peptidoglycan-associated protein
MGKKFSGFILLFLLAALFTGCVGMDLRVRRPGYLYYPSEIIQADRAVMAAEAAGKAKECPAEYNALKARVDQAYEVYHSCRNKEAIEIANDTLEKVNRLCPPKPVQPSPTPPPPPPPPPAPVPAPVQPAPEPLPPPAPEKVIEKLTLHVNFDVDKATIRKADEAVLEKAIDFIKKYPNARFRIEGHTDYYGTDAYNQKLSERRAEAVKRYLVSKGNFDDARFSTAGFGESRPIASNKTNEGRFKNRRVEISAVSE